MNKILQAIFLLFIASTQSVLAAVQISDANLCQYTTVSSDILTATVTDAGGNPKLFAGVSFSVLSDPHAAFVYPVTYTDEHGVAATVLSLMVTPTDIQVQIQAQDLATGEIASKTIPVQGHVCEISTFNSSPITAVAGNTYIATGANIGWSWYSNTFTAYSTDPRVAVPVSDAIVAGPLSFQQFALDINPRQAGQGYILVPNANAVPITVLAPDVNAPVITSQPKTTTDIYRPYLYQVNASSPLGKTLTYALTVGPAGMQLNAQTGLLDWTPGLANVGSQVIKLTVSDGTLSTYQHYRLQVTSTQTALYVGPVAVSGESGATMAWTPLVVTSFSPIVPACAIATAPANGTATVAADCSSGSYQSNPGFVGTDSFFYRASICPTPTGPCYFDSDSVTVAVTEPPPTDPCLAQYPVAQFSQTGKEGTLTISLTGNITSHTNKEVKICPGTALKYTTTSTQGPVVCKVKNNTTRGSGTLKINDHLKCTDKPAGKDKIQFKVKSGVK